MTTAEASGPVTEPPLNVVGLESVSLSMGEALVFSLNRAAPTVGLLVVRVQELEDTFALAAPCEASLESPTRLTCRFVDSLEPGIYALIALDLIESMGHALPTRLPLRPPRLFEVRPAGSSPRTLEQIEAAYKSVVAHRINALERGMGTGPVKCSVFVFVKDLLLTTPLHLGRYQVQPLDPIGWTAEKDAVDQCWAQIGNPPLPWPEELVAEIRQAEPAVLIHFPTVNGESIDDCCQQAVREAQLLTGLLAAHRGSMGAPVCTLTIDHTTERLAIAMYPPPYSGNLMGGPVSGEDPASLRAQLPRLAANPTLEFYVNLLGEALRETRTEFRYVRFWSLLETIARSRGYLGHPLRDWEGRQRFNAKGKPRVIRDDAQELVYELLRDALQPRGITEQTFASGHSHGSLSQQLELCYRRRNCVAHGDPVCVCRNPSLAPSATQLYRRCYESRRNDPLSDNHHLRTLREIATLVVFTLL